MNPNLETVSKCLLLLGCLHYSDKYGESGPSIGTFYIVFTSNICILLQTKYMGSWNNLGKKCTEFNDACVIFRACKIINKINSNPQRRAGLQTWFAPLGSPFICSHSGCIISWSDNVIFWRKLARLGTDLCSCWSAEIRPALIPTYHIGLVIEIIYSVITFLGRNNANVRTLNRKWIKAPIFRRKWKL